MASSSFDMHSAGVSEDKFEVLYYM